jgi:CheY-like chemotaxis protein
VPVILICTTTALGSDLSRTLLWRHEFERHLAERYEQALAMAVAAQPRMTLVDRRLPRAVELVRTLRAEAGTRQTSLVVIAPGDFEPSELELLDAGANAILRLPADAGWDARLDQLLRVPARREGRFAVNFAVEATLHGDTVTGSAANLSAHGMLLVTTAPVAVGDGLTFAFRLRSAAVRGRGRIVRQAAPGQYGVLFETLYHDALAEIQAYVASLEKP